MSSDVEQLDLGEFNRDVRALLDAAFENGEPSSVRDEYVEEPSRAFSRWHRTLAGYYTMIDIDWAHYHNDTKEVYLLCETITVPEEAVGEGVDEVYPVDDHKRHVLLGLAAAADIPAAVVWHSEACDRFFVKELTSDDPELRGLDGDIEYQDWLDEYRLGDGGGDGR